MAIGNQEKIYHAIRDSQRKRSRNTERITYDNRLASLTLLKDILTKHEQQWLDVLKQDLGKAAVEAFASELAVLLNEIDYVSNQLKKWMKPTSHKRALLTGVERTKTVRQPYGSVLVLSPWNYPLQLSLMPVIGALSAGNGVVLKPSEFAPATSRLLAELVPKYFEPDTFFIIEGDEEVAETLTQMDWDFIVFTGSERIGRKVYEAAAKYLTPVLLELGGKNPCIMDKTGITPEAIRQIVWGKFLNAGQSCIAPDTLYVPRDSYQEVINQITQCIELFYGENPIQSPDYGRIIHQKAFQRLVNYLDDGDSYYGGDYGEEDLYISPTVLINTKSNSAIQKEEIFGPILPIMAYDSLNDVIDELSNRPVPLVIYTFSKDKENIKRLKQELESGSFSINQVIAHATSPHVPFGGKGASGMGRYHGRASFEAFTYERAVYSKKSVIPFKKQYPPYSAFGLTALRKLRNHIF
ncbi:aldehyde dehydrogenase family protein [Alkalibacterium sp. MB6]|uniref:aldehyde dehydrogenase family protein n=1 Tax=Alkalibacterium sp. MB6 TaxID=2081965 RepID=UPI001379B6EF|nr:aldehyde dehydrogenase family protein [Alkalibacterium sp. MB6]